MLQNQPVDFQIFGKEKKEKDPRIEELKRKLQKAADEFKEKLGTACDLVFDPKGTAFSTTIANDQKEFAKTQYENCWKELGVEGTDWILPIEEVKNTKAIFTKGKEYFEGLPKKIQEQYNLQLDKIKNSALDPSTKTEAEKKLKNAQDELEKAVTAYQKQQLSLLGELVYISWMRSEAASKLYETVYGHEMPQEEQEERFTKLASFRPSETHWEVFINRWKKDFYTSGTIKVDQDSVTFSINSGSEVISTALNVSRIKKIKNMIKDGTYSPGGIVNIKMTVPMPEGKSTASVQSRHIDNVMKLAAEQGIYLEVVYPQEGSSYIPSGQVLKERDERLKKWVEKKQESLTNTLSISEEGKVEKSLLKRPKS